MTTTAAAAKPMRMMLFIEMNLRPTIAPPKIEYSEAAASRHRALLKAGPSAGRR
jgi:hypothetical protein